MRWQTYEPRLAVMSAYPDRDKRLAWYMMMRCFCLNVINHDRRAAE